MPRECPNCLTLMDRDGVVYLLPPAVLDAHRLPSEESPILLAELTADTGGFGSEPAAVALWLPPAALAEGKAEILRRLAALPLEALEQAERTVRAEVEAGGAPA
jgi:hypothetical protein